MYKTMNSCLDKNARPLDSEIEKIPSFLFCRYLSGSPNLILAANTFNLYNKIPIISQWKAIQGNFAGKGIRYPKYPKIPSESVDIESLVKSLQKKYQINRDLAFDYSEFLDDDEKIQIIEKYKDFI